MTEPGIHITVHDQFKRGDRVRLGRDWNGEFVTESTLDIGQDSVSVTFAGVSDRTDYVLVVDRVVPGGAEPLVTLERADKASVDVAGAKVVQYSDGLLTSTVVWEEWPTVEAPGSAE